MVGDERWSYDGLLPYFRKTENHHDPQTDPHQHGFDGPIHSAPALSRTHPLTKQLKEACLKIGIRPISDHNGGDNNGMAPHIENWHHGKRQPAGKAYGLREVEVFTNITVKRIVLQDSSGSSKKATGVELASGQILKANKEVIVCCGALRTPQLLMLSGIGPADELQKHSIPLLVEAPDVGKSLFDHGALTQSYRIHNPEKGLCVASPS